jgi:hypothetical protein
MSTAAGTSPQMQLLIDENVPKSVADFLPPAVIPSNSLGMS